MRKGKLPPWSHPSAWREPAEKFYRSHRARKTLRIVVVVLAVFALLGFFAAPPLIRSQLQRRLSQMLQRPVTVQQVHLNPFTLRLALDDLHIGDRNGHGRFVDVDHLVINASWSSLFRWAPILDQLQLDRPRIVLSRDGPQHFNVSDLIDRFSGDSGKPDAPPARFALYNIRIHQGDIVFEDAVQKSRHEVAGIELGLPFIASLPSDTDVFVQPLLAMTVDGSAVKLAGQFKPFASTRESVMHFRLDRLDLPRYLDYVPTLPVSVTSGQLSGELDLHFIAAPKTPRLSLTGALQLDQLAVTGKDAAPLFSLQQAQAQLVDVQPLIGRYTLGNLRLDRPDVHYVRFAGGRSNIDALLGDGKSTGGAATAVRIGRLDISGGHLAYLDQSAAAPTALHLENLHGNLVGLSTVKAPAAVLDLAAQLGGGSLTAKGALDTAASAFRGNVMIDGVDLSPLQAIADPTLAATLAGKLAVQGQLQAQWHGPFNAQLSDAHMALTDVVLLPTKYTDSAVRWKKLSFELNHFNLLKQQALLGTLSINGLSVDGQRLSNGQIDLATLGPPSAATSATSATTSSVPEADGGKKSGASQADAANGGWHWHIDHVVLDDAAIALTDQKAAGKPPTFKFGKVNLTADGLSDDMRQPLKIDTSGAIGKSGSYRITGTVTRQPLDAQLQITTTRINLAPFENYGSVPLNVQVSSALLTSDGRVHYAQHGDQSTTDYRGRVTLGRVRVQDKVSGDDFIRWEALTLNGLSMQLGNGAPKLSMTALALDQFYARLIINANGRLNTQDVVSNPAAAPVSVTRVETAPAPAASAPPPAVANLPAPEVHIGAVSVTNSQLNYTDNFIKPNYTANITQLSGKIGGFGTDPGPPAILSLQGELDDNSPVDIEGSINPLAPVAFLDITGKAEGIELTNLSAYAGKYTGYPITKGRLNADVHYQLDQRKLTADNHIFIDQLTFGDRLEGQGISHLPVKLAVALLKDSQGRIDVHLPVSGSLDDPKFSVGGLVWHAFVNLIGRAVTAPFRLLASAFGGSSRQDLGYVAFAPGSSELGADAQKKLALIAKALTEKPSLNLDIVGRADPSKDESGLRSVTLDQFVRAEQRDDEGTKAGAQGGIEAPLSPDDYNKYLAKAYKHAKFRKPRDLIGLTKSQPPDVMKSMLEANVSTDTDAMRHLAQQRADAVRGWLRGKVPDQRLFVLAPKLDAKGIDDKGATTRVDFGLH
jgi:uncharacterized protein involved in outer membrane biogenesis